MKRLLLPVFAVLLLLATVSCVTTQGARFIKVEPPLTSESNVYIYRPFSTMGCGSSPAVLHNGNKIHGLLSARTFYKYSIKPGTHTFKTSLLLARAIPVTIENEKPGQTYYIRIEYQFGVPFAFKMVEVSEAEALAELPSCFDVTGKQNDSETTATDIKPIAQSKNVTTVKVSQNKTVPTEKKVKKATLFVVASPENARVRILNIKPVFKQGIVLDGGRYHIEVTAKGYQQNKQWVTLAQGKSLQLKVRLKPVVKLEAKPVVVTAPASNPLPKINNPEISRLEGQLQDKNPIVKRDTAKRIFRSHPANPHLLAVVQRELKKGFMRDSQNTYHIDAMAWYCKYLGASGDSKFKDFLLKVADESPSRKLRSYAKKNADML